MSPLCRALDELLAKYTELARLRREREAVAAEGAARFAEAAARARGERFRALAVRFPGALRELERLDAVALANRAADVQDELDLAHADGARTHPGRLWVRLMLAYHESLRASLRERQPGPVGTERRPTPSPGARASRAALEGVARAHGLEVEEVGAILFPSPFSRERPPSPP